MLEEEKPDRHPSGQPDSVRSTGAALEAHYRFVLWLVPAVERFPRSQKFLLGDRIQDVALDVLERLIEATYTKQRDRHLAGANLGLEKLRSLCRLARDLRCLDHRRCEHAARSLNETGPRVGDERSGTAMKSAGASSLLPRHAGEGLPYLCIRVG